MYITALLDVTLPCESLGRDGPWTSPDSCPCHEQSDCNASFQCNNRDTNRCTANTDTLNTTIGYAYPGTVTITISSTNDNLQTNKLPDYFSNINSYCVARSLAVSFGLTDRTTFHDLCSNGCPIGEFHAIIFASTNFCTHYADGSTHDRTDLCAHHGDTHSFTNH